MAGWQNRDEDCDFVGTEHEFWQVRPTRDGLAFYPDLPHGAMACADTVVVPYSEVRPLLNATGLSAIQEIVEDLRSLKQR